MPIESAFNVGFYPRVNPYRIYFVYIFEILDMKRKTYEVEINEVNPKLSILLNKIKSMEEQK